jgi:hypothetical protein
METTAELKPAIRHAGHQMTETEARAKIDAYVNQYRASSVKTVQSILEVVPTDQVIPAAALRFASDSGVIEYFAPGKEGSQEDIVGTLHRNALSQLAGRLDIPMSYIDHLTGAMQAVDGQPEPNRWGLDFLAKTLKEHAIHSPDRYLIRSIGNEARGILSDKFRRIDCRPSALQLLEQAREKGMIVASGSFTDTRSTLKIIRPQPIEVFPGEWMVFGFDWSNSDYGRGANDLRLFFYRAWCWNGACLESVVRQIHIGKRLNDDVDYQQDTLDADAKATALALRDAAASAMSETKVQRMIEGIRAANEVKIDSKNRVEAARKVLTKGEVEKVVETFNSADIENLPAGNTLWRWSNAISWVGGHLDDADRAIDFERYAGDVLKPALPKEQVPAPIAA